MTTAALLVKRDTTANWQTSNRVLNNAELGVEETTAGIRLMKIGDGFTPWNDLPYLNSGPGGAGGLIPITQQSASYDFQSSDLGTRVEYTGGGAGIFTIPLGIGVGGAELEFAQMGAGALSVAIASGGVLNVPTGFIAQLAAQYASGGLICDAPLGQASDVWTISGRLAT